MAIRIIDKDFNLFGEIDGVTNLYYERSAYGIGEFQFIINPTVNGAIELKKNRIIYFDNDPKKAYIILERGNAYDELGDANDELCIKGVQLKGILTRRIILPKVGEAYLEFKGKQSEIFKKFVINCIGDLTDESRKINNFKIEPSQPFGEIDAWRGRYNKLSDLLESMGKYTKIAWDVILDFKTKTFKFIVTQGNDFTSIQHENPPVIFSKEFGTLNSRQFTESITAYVNALYCGGAGEDENRLIQVVGNGNGFERQEGFEDMTSYSDPTELITQGKKKLETLKPLLYLEGGINPFGTFKLGKDYDINDKVTVVDKSIGVELHSRIINIRETDDGTRGIELTFGETYPSFIDILRKKGGVR